MDTARSPRPLPLLLTALVACFSALVALAVSNGGTAHAHGTPAAAAGVSRAELDLRLDMRRLWEDHVVWTRQAIVALVARTPDTEAAVARLLSNQVDIGDAVKPFYGTAAGNRLTRELRGHILIAADVVLAARAGDAAKLADAQRRWRANADDIAAVLASVNPRFWKAAPLRRMLGEHLTLTTREAVARLEGDWDADVAAYDAVHHHALGMADALSTGIVKQFPRRFR